MISVLFVCLGNICRSPLAEGIFQEIIQQRNWQNYVITDSAGIGGWHAGELPHQRSRIVAAECGIELIHRARQIQPAEMSQWTYILGMDNENMAALQRLMPKNSVVKLSLLREYDPTPGDYIVPDPYYGDMSDYWHVYELCKRSLHSFADMLQQEYGLP
jgi:protein-tyrosine phosphatase